MDEPNDIPENATAMPPGEYTEAGELETEPSVSNIPEGIDEIPEINRTGGVTPHEAPGPESPPDNVVYKSIWPPLIMAFILGAALGSLTYILIPSNSRQPTAEEIAKAQAQQTAQAPPPRDTTTPGNTRLMLSEGFVMGSSSLARDVAIERISQAVTNIIWVTNFPNDPAILQALAKREGTPAIIIVGNDASKSNCELAKKMKLGVIRAKQTLNDSEGFLIIDNQYVIDIGRNNTVWESIDPFVSDTTRKWVDSMLSTASPL